MSAKLLQMKDFAKYGNLARITKDDIPWMGMSKCVKSFAVSEITYKSLV